MPAAATQTVCECSNSNSGVLASLQRIEAALELLRAQVERIDANSERNRVVAEKYGDRADSLFSVVDTVGNVLHRANPLTYLPRALMINDDNSDYDSD